MWPTLWRLPRVLTAGIAEPDDEQVERRGAFAPSPGQAHGATPRRLGLVAAAVVGGRVALGGALGLAPSAAPSAPSSTSSTSSSRASWTLAITISSGSSSSVTPSGTATSESRSVSPIPSAGDVGLEVLRDLERERLDVDLVRDLVEDAALAHADRVADERDHDRGLDRLVEPDFLKVDVRDVAANLVALEVLEDRRVSGAAVDRDVEHGVRPGRARQRRPQVALADRDRDRRRSARRGRPGSAPACAGGATRQTRAGSAPKRRA